MLATWTFEGPAPLTNSISTSGGSLNLDPNFGAGAIEAIAVHTDAKTIYVGSVNGGVWKTTDADKAIPSWKPLTDFHDSLSISAIAISPIDINEDGTLRGTVTGTTIYAGTGSFSSGGAASGDAIGVLRSTDGLEFKPLDGGEVFSASGLKIRSVVPPSRPDADTRQQIVFVAAVDSTGRKGGVYVSRAAGKNFTKVSGAEGSGLPDAPATHLVYDNSPLGIVQNRVYAAVIGNSIQQGVAGVYTSVFPNKVWTKVTTGIPQRTLDHVERIELAVGRSDGTLYATLLGDGSALRTAVTTGGAMSNRLAVEASDAFREGDAIQIGFVPNTTLKDRARSNSNIVVLEDGDLDLHPGDFLRIVDKEGPFFRRVMANLGGGRIRLTATLPRNVKSGTTVVPFAENATVTGVSGGQLTIDTDPKVAGNQGVEFNWGAGRIVRGRGNERAVALFQSTNRGALWTELPLPQPNGELEENGKTKINAPQTGLHPGNQADTHFSIAVSPVDSNLLFLGGDRQPGTNSAGCPGSEGRLFVGVISPASTGVAGASWDHLVCGRTMADRKPEPPGTPDGVPDTPTAPHADSREIVFASDGSILEASDGGIARFTPVENFASKVGDASQNLGVWSSLAGNLGTIEFYGVAYDSFTNTIFGGAQDNGFPLQSAAGSTQFLEAKGGDGTIPAVLATATGSTRFYTSQGFGVGRQTTSAATSQVTRLSISDAATPSNSLKKFDFVQQWALHEADASRVLTEHPTPVPSTNASRHGSLFELQLQAGMGLVEVRSFSHSTLKTTNMDLSAAQYGFVPADDPTGPNLRNDLIYAGFTQKRNPRARGKLFFRESGTDALAKLRKYRGAGIRDIVVNPLNFKQIIVIDAKGEVWLNSDAPGGRSFKKITGDLKALTGGDIRSVEFVNLTGTAGDEVLLVGGLGGVFQLQADPFQTGLRRFRWKKLGDGFPNVLVTDLHYDRTDDLLLAGTWGRGAWTIKNFKDERGVFPAAATAGASLIAPAGGSRLSQSAVTARGGDFTLALAGTSADDSFLIRRSDANPLLLEAFVNGDAVETGAPIELVSLAQIAVDGLAGDDTLVVDVSNGVIGLPGSDFTEGDVSIRFDGGVGNDTVELVGGPLMTTSSSYNPDEDAGIVLLASSDALGEIQLLDVETLDTVDWLKLATISCRVWAPDWSISQIGLAVCSTHLPIPSRCWIRRGLTHLTALRSSRTERGLRCPQAQTPLSEASASRPARLSAGCLKPVPMPSRVLILGRESPRPPNWWTNCRHSETSPSSRTTRTDLYLILQSNEDYQVTLRSKSKCSMAHSSSQAARRLPVKYSLTSE